MIAHIRIGQKLIDLSVRGDLSTSHKRLRQVANGRSVPINAPVMLSTQAPAATPAQAAPAASRNAGERPSAEADSKVALLGSVGS